MGAEQTSGTSVTSASHSLTSVRRSSKPNSAIPQHSDRVSPPGAPLRPDQLPPVPTMSERGGTSKADSLEAALGKDMHNKGRRLATMPEVESEASLLSLPL